MLNDLHIKLYSTPVCHACKALKNELPKSNYKEYVEEINLLADDVEFKFAQSKRILSVPTLYATYQGRECIITGLRPISVIDDLITEFIRY